MKKLIKFPSIEQFNRIVKNVKHETQFKGIDDNGDPICDRHAEMPILKFKGTVKLHGTNAGCSYNNEDGFWAQSRNNIITTENDNAGFAFFATQHQNFLTNAIIEIANVNKISLCTNTITVYGEWAGKGIQKGVAISEVDKFFAIFGVKVTPHDGGVAYWINDEFFRYDNSKKIYNIKQFGEFEIEIDFNRPKLVQNDLVELTKQVEMCCPAGKFFNVTGIGEGIVWVNGSHRFKVKGEKHSQSKVKTLSPVDVERINKSIDFANIVCKSWRLEQGVQEVFDTLNGGEPDIKGVGKLIKWVMSDVLKEEIELMEEMGLEPRNCAPHISKITVSWFKDTHC